LSNLRSTRPKKTNQTSLQDPQAAPRFILVVDADTVFVRPQSFEDDGRIIIDYIGSIHQPYVDLATVLIREMEPLPVSTTCHHILVDSTILQEMKNRIESRHDKKWFEAIQSLMDNREASSFSEYATYGLFVAHNFGADISFRHWRNFSSSKNLRDPDRRVQRTLRPSNWFLTVSFHSWMQKSH